MVYDPKDRRWHPGISHVGSYQVSAMPYATSSITVNELGTAPTEIVFDRVTRFVTVKNTLATGGTNVPLRVGFSHIGVSGSHPGFNNFFTLDNGESYTGEWRLASIFLLSDAADAGCTGSVIAGLTPIPSTDLSDGSYPNWTGSLGVS